MNTCKQSGNRTFQPSEPYTTIANPRSIVSSAPNAVGAMDQSQRSKNSNVKVTSEIGSLESKIVDGEKSSCESIQRVETLPKVEVTSV